MKCGYSFGLELWLEVLSDSTWWWIFETLTIDGDLGALAVVLISLYQFNCTRIQLILLQSAN